MPKRRRLLTPLKNRSKANAIKQEELKVGSEVEESTPRGRLKGALLEALEPTVEEFDSIIEHTPVKKDRKEYTSEEEDKCSKLSQTKESAYVLKLFDRNVNLSQFTFNSPLYPLCRAWVVNKPRLNYKELGYQSKKTELENAEESVELPGPEGPTISKIPNLTPEQISSSKDNVNLNYREAPPPSRSQLLEANAARWANVRAAWLERAAHVEARYSATQRLLNKINVNAM